MSAIFKNRTDAATRLAAALVHHSPACSVVYAIPHGGVLTGNIVANALGVPLRVVTAAGDATESQRLRTLYQNSPLAVEAGTAIIVDEGMIRGEAMARAIAEVRKTDPLRIIAAVPAATSKAVQRVRPLADETLVLYEMADGVEDLRLAHGEFEPVSSTETAELFRAKCLVP